MGLSWSIVLVDRRVGEVRAAGQWALAMAEETAWTQEPRESRRNMVGILATGQAPGTVAAWCCGHNACPRELGARTQGHPRHSGRGTGTAKRNCLTLKLRSGWTGLKAISTRVELAGCADTHTTQPPDERSGGCPRADCHAPGVAWAASARKEGIEFGRARAKSASRYAVLTFAWVRVMETR